MWLEDQLPLAGGAGRTKARSDNRLSSVGTDFRRRVISPGVPHPGRGGRGCLSPSLPGIGSTGRALGVVLQLNSAKQLSIRGYDDGGQAHRDRPHAHGEIESPVDQKAGSDRNSDKVVGRRPNQVLDLF